MKRVLMLGGLLLVLVAVALGLAIAVRATSVTQPIAFNHRLHLETVEMECVDCHVQAADHVRATIPNIEVCGACHAEQLGESSAEAEVVAHIGGEQPIPWAAVYRMPDHVYFSHRRHVALGGIECETCHGDVRERTRPFTRPLVRQTMAWCIACHEEKGALNDCVGCHR